MRLEILPAAKRDLYAIQDYGIEQFGLSQAEAYIDGIWDKLRLVLKLPKIAPPRPDWGRDIRSLSHESHVIIYRTKKDTVQNVRILGARQNWQIEK